MAAPIYATQVSVGGSPHAHHHVRSYPLPSPSSAKLVKASSSNQRPSIELKISSSGAKILNTVVLYPAGQPLYTISSNKSRTKLLSQRDNAKVATIDWDRSSPRMVFRGKKVKCKEWLPRAGPETESRIFVHGDSQFTWMQKSDRGILIPANRQGLAVAKWRTESRNDGLRLQIFQEVFVEPGLLEAILLSLILLQSGHPFGDTLPSDLGPKYYGVSLTGSSFCLHG